MNAKSKIESIKKHILENKKVYIGTTVGLVVGATFVLLVTKPKIKVTQRVNSLITYKSPIIQIALPSLGHPGNAVQCLESGTVYASQGEAARALSVSSSLVSNHLKGKVLSVNGNHLVKLTDAGVPIA